MICVWSLFAVTSEILTPEIVQGNSSERQGRHDGCVHNFVPYLQCSVCSSMLGFTFSGVLLGKKAKACMHWVIMPTKF